MSFVLVCSVISLASSSAHESLRLSQSSTLMRPKGMRHSSSNESLASRELDSTLCAALTAFRSTTIVSQPWVPTSQTAPVRIIVLFLDKAIFDNGLLKSDI